MCKIADKIKELRIEAGITQPELAKLVGVSNGTISFWENGLSTPRFSYIKKLAVSLNTTSDYLLEEEKRDMNQHELTQDEERLLQAYRKMSEGKKKALFSMLDIGDMSDIKTQNDNK